MAVSKVRNQGLKKSTKRPAGQPANPAIPWHPLRATNELTASLILVFVVVLFRSRIFDNFSYYFIGGAEYDSGLYLWLIKTNLNNFSAWFQNLVLNFFDYILIEREAPPSFEFWFNTPAFYPYGSTLAWSDNFLLPSLLVGILLKTGLSFAAAWNSLILLALFLNGYFTYRLVFRLTGDILSAALSGMAFMSWPWFGEHSGHPQLQFAFFIPLIIGQGLRFFKFGTIGSALRVFGSILLALLTTAYYSIMGGISVLVIYLALLLCRRDLFTKRILTNGVIAGFIALPFFYPFIQPYFDVARTFGERQSLEHYVFAATGLSYISAATYSWLYGPLTANLSSHEGRLFAGALVLLGGLLGVVFQKHKKERLWTVLTVGSFLTTMILTEVTRVELGQYQSKILLSLTLFTAWCSIICAYWTCKKINAGSKGIDITSLILLLVVVMGVFSLGPIIQDPGAFNWGPYTVLFEHLPGAGAMRVTARLGVVVVLSLTILMGLLFSRLPALNPQIASIKLLLAVLILVENFNFIFPLEKSPTRPEIFQTVGNMTNRSDAVFVFPYFPPLDENKRIPPGGWGDFAKLNVNYMNWSIGTHFRLVNGYSGQTNWFMREYPQKLANFPDARSVRALSYIPNLKFILVIPSLIPNFDLNQFKTKLSELKDGLKIKKIDSQGNILLRLQATNEIGDAFSVIAPPDRGLKNFLSFDVRGATIPGFPQRTLQVLDRATGQVLASESITHDGRFKRIELSLEPNGGRVGFRHLLLKVIEPLPKDSDNKSNSKVFVRDILFEVY
jgi:hypothetical protein